MREFAKGGFTLRRAARALRLIYAGFLFLIAIGLLTQLGFQIGRIGLTPRAIARYYRGDETGEVLAFPKTFGQLLEITHAHAFTMGLVFLVLAHLFVATEASPSIKGAVIGATFVGLVGDLTSPWLTRYLAAGCAWAALGSWILEDLGLALMVCASGWACLRPSEEAR